MRAASSPGRPPCRRLGHVLYRSMPSCTSVLIHLGQVLGRVLLERREAGLAAESHKLGSCDELDRITHRTKLTAGNDTGVQRVRRPLGIRVRLVDLGHVLPGLRLELLDAARATESDEAIAEDVVHRITHRSQLGSGHDAGGQRIGLGLLLDDLLVERLEVLGRVVLEPRLASRTAETNKPVVVDEVDGLAIDPSLPPATMHVSIG